MTCAKHLTTFFVYAKLIFSFGPWMFASGAVTPSATICASGYLISNSLRKGMEPPSPNDP